MTAAEVKAAFPSEAALCDCFIATLHDAGGWTVYPETAGFDILAVYETGHQLGIEAKLALNAKVADQILPSGYAGAETEGPDFRAVIVPVITESSYGIARMLRMLGVQAWAPDAGWRRGQQKPTFERALNPDGAHSGLARRAYDARHKLGHWNTSWFDWNPTRRCKLPEIVPLVRAGVPSPLQLTPWKIAALRVLADLELDGFVTAKSVRERSVDPRRFCASDGWLKSLGDGKWGRGNIPAFEQQHPEAYAEILAAAAAQRQAAAA